MKIAIIATHPIQYQAPLYRELARRSGVDLTVFFAHRPSPEEQGEGFGVPFSWDIDLTEGYRHEFLKNRSRSPTVGFHGYDCPELGEKIRRGGFQAVLVQGWAWKCMWQAMRACRHAEISYGVRSDSQLPGPVTGLIETLRWRLKALIYPRFIRKFPICLPYGIRSAEFFRRLGGKNIRTSVHFVDNEWWGASAERSRAVGKRGKAEKSVEFLFAGKFIPKKRVMDLLEAAAQVPEARVVLVGDGPLREQLKARAEKPDLKGRVEFAGFRNQTELPAYLAGADWLVLPSDRGETWGLVVNEAMACGTPVIVSDACGCVPDLIEPGVTGWSYACGNTAELAGWMRKGLVRAGARQMGDAGRGKVETSFHVRRAADQLVQALEENR
jgi:glycosyltransferase involved in cell wall biosynthesis